MRTLILLGLTVAVMLAAPAHAQAVPPMQFAVHRSDDGNDWIQADGLITADSPADFQRYLSSWYEGFVVPRTIRLNSEGGDVLPAVLLGELFRQGGFSTEIGATGNIAPLGRYPVTGKKPGICVSACGYAFLGGLSRSAQPGELGFHQFRSSAPPAQTAGEVQAITGALVKYLKHMDIDSEVLVLAAETPPEEMTTPDAATMARLRITTQAQLGRLHFAH